jgi:Lhr-like helicase
MKHLKKLGIWLDHASAHVMELTTTPLKTKIIASSFTHQEELSMLSKSEKMMHNLKQSLQKKYYDEIGEIIKGHDEVLLFGPTDAKIELYNLLKSDLHFKDIKIEIKQADKMTENQMHAYVRNYFLNEAVECFKENK